MLKEILSNEKKILKEENIDKGGNTLNGNVFKAKKYLQRDTRKGEIL